MPKAVRLSIVAAIAALTAALVVVSVMPSFF
jgi:hypothetical protein